MYVFLVEAAGEVDTRRDVAPLIRAADLQLAAIAFVQLGKVVALQQTVGKLGVGNALFVAADALLNRFLLDHGIDREVLADVAQELQCAHAAKPVVVIGHDRRIRTFEVEEGGYLTADFIDPAGDDVRCVELAFVGLETRVANHPGCAADECNWLVSGHLKALEQEHRHQMPEVQAVRRWVEAAI